MNKAIIFLLIFCIMGCRNDKMIRGYVIYPLNSSITLYPVFIADNIDSLDVFLETRTLGNYRDTCGLINKESKIYYINENTFENESFWKEAKILSENKNDETLYYLKVKVKKYELIEIDTSYYKSNETILDIQKKYGWVTICMNRYYMIKIDKFKPISK